MNYNYNLDWETRDRLIFGDFNEKRYWGGIASYEGLPLRTVKELMIRGFIDPEVSQNDSPTNREFIDFVEKYPEFTFHGYVVSPKRDDYRFSIEGIDGSAYKDRKTVQLLEDYMNTFKFANEMDLETLRCWYD